MSNGRPFREVLPAWNDALRKEAEQLLEECIDRLNAGDRLDLAKIDREHPEVGPEVIRQLKAFEGTADDSAAALPLGTLGDYKLLRQIGRGGMGIVYEAWEGSMDRRVALKVLPAGIAADDRAVTRFIQEARVAGKLNHPSVVSVYGMGVKEQIPYYAMDFVEGETLAQIVARLKDLEPEAETPFGHKDGAGYFESLARAFADVADGLQHAHSKKIIHRDIKPSNLILDREGRLRILDFGLARLEGQESLTISGDVVGTPQYMSPEQARRKKITIDHRTDVYSLGATLYEMLTLRPPFRGKDHAETPSQIIERDPPKPSGINPRIPPDFETIVLKCLRKEAGVRYGTAEALGQDLRRFARGDAIEASPQGGWERALRRVRRHRWRIAAGMVVAAVLAGAGWLLLDRLGREREWRERVHGERVVSAALRLELASQLWNASSNLGGLGHLVEAMELPGAPAIDPAELALKELEEASALVPGRPDVRYHRARALVLLGRYEDARQALEPLLELRPSFVPALNLLADLHGRTGEADRAAELFRQAEQLATGGWSRAWLEAWRGWREGKPGEAAAAYTRLLAECARGHEPFLGCGLAARLSRGSAYLQAGEPMKAARDFAMAHALAPDAVEPALLEASAWNALGRTADAAKLLEETYERSSEKDEVALIAANQCLDLRDEKGMHAWLERVSVPSVRELIRSQSLFQLGHIEAAEQAARKAVSHDRRNYKAWDRLGFMLREQRPLPEAHAAIEAGLKVAPDFWELHETQGGAYFREGEFAKAAASYERAARLNKGGYRSDLYRLAATYLLMGEDDKAAAATEEAHRRNPGNAEGEINLALGYFRRGRLVESLEAAERGIAGTPEFAYPYYWKGLVLLHLNREEEAIAAWRAAQPLFPISPILFILPAMLLEGGGRPEEALSDLLRALPRLPGDDRIHAMLERCLRRCRGKLDPSKIDDARVTIEAASVKEPANGWARHSLALVEVLRAPPASDAIERALALLLGVLDEQKIGLHLGVVAARSLAEAADLSDAEGGGSVLNRLAALPSPAATDALLAGRETLAGVESVPDRLLNAGTAGVEAQARLLYLKARLAEKGGDLQDALEILGRIQAKAAAPEVTLRLARLHCDAGNPRRAEEALRSALVASPGRDRRLWDAWLGVSSGNLARSPAEVLAALPTLSGSADAVPRKEDYGNDVRWLLERLVAGEPIRINCGGADYQDPRDRLFGRDRFSLGGTAGKPWAMDIAGTDMDPIYQSERVFDPWLPPAVAAYAIPLPPGRYRVRLHFAEVWCAVPGSRRFDVSIQGVKVVEDLAIAREVGFATALVKEREATVERGGLSIHFQPVNATAAKISAIEIERQE